MSLKTIAIAVCAAIVGGLAVIGWNKIGGSYYECVVSEMRGMPSIMLGRVVRMCSERYGRPK